MAEEKVYMPAGMGGLVRFGEEEEEVFKLKPTHVMIFVAGVTVLEIALKLVAHL
jgi:preprotein translocase subunit Sec61beta